MKESETVRKVFDEARELIDIYDWIHKEIESCRINAMHAHTRNDMTAFENINAKKRRFEKIAEILEEKVDGVR